MNAFTLIFLLFLSGSIMISLLLALTKIVVAGWLLTRVGDHWQQFNNYFEELSRLIALYDHSDVSKTSLKKVSRKINHRFWQMQDKITHLEREQRQEAQVMKKILLEEADAAGLLLRAS